LTLCLITLGFIAYNVYGMIKDRERL